MSEKYYCMFYCKVIEKGLCFDINLENENAFKEDELKALKKRLGKTNDEIKNICKHCPYYPL